MATAFTQTAPTMPDTSYSAYLNQDGSVTNQIGRFFGSIFGGYKNWANSQLAQYQNSYNQWQQEYANWYNSPENQRQLYTDAGFNDNLVVGPSTGSSSTSPISAQVPDVSDVGKNAFSSFAQLISMASGILGLRAKSAQIDNLSIENLQKRANLQFFKESIPDKLDLIKNTANNSFLKYQSGLMQNYKNDWLLGTEIMPTSSELSGISSSPFAARFSLETEGLKLTNELRNAQRILSSLQGHKLKYYNDNLLPKELLLLEGKISLQDIEKEFKEAEKKLNLTAGALSPLLTLLRIIVK